MALSSDMHLPQQTRQACKRDACIDKFTLKLQMLPKTYGMSGTRAIDFPKVPEIKKRWHNRRDGSEESMLNHCLSGIVGFSNTTSLTPLSRDKNKGGNSGSEAQGHDVLLSLRELKKVPEVERSSASLDCCGSILVADGEKDAETMKPTLPSVRVSWSLTSNVDAKNVVLPLDKVMSDSSTSALERMGDQEVLHPHYRHAEKLDPSYLTTSFHPADLGILKAIERILLPQCQYR
ncbi:hypothetical protein ETB97_001737 [Aspergillus alliaceus]|uniref:Uncharacterized protein n=1 Tax=Petromyces alliaceus TaxID=209559 RepID=A0A8H6A2F2_PETAA|nr:hypothetical protein ETB97_001737 [Aspergillus burnettii]